MTETLNPREKEILAKYGAWFCPERLSLARRRRGLTKSMLAAAVGVSPKTVGLWSQYAQPSEEHLAKLSAVLDFPVRFFFMPPPPELNPGSLSHLRITPRWKLR